MDKLEDDLMTVNQLALLLKVTERSVQGWIKKYNAQISLCNENSTLQTITLVKGHNTYLSYEQVIKIVELGKGEVYSSLLNDNFKFKNALIVANKEVAQNKNEIVESLKPIMIEFMNKVIANQRALPAPITVVNPLAEELNTNLDIMYDEIKQVQSKLDKMDTKVNSIAQGKKIKIVKEAKPKLDNSYVTPTNIKVKRVIKNYVENYMREHEGEDEDKVYAMTYSKLYTCFDTYVNSNIQLLYKDVLIEKGINKTKYSLIKFIEDEGYIDILYEIAIANFSI